MNTLHSLSLQRNKEAKLRLEKQKLIALILTPPKKQKPYPMIHRFFDEVECK